MAEILNDEVLAAANGGTNTTDPSGAHWQAVNHTMGTDWIADSTHGKQLWYRVKTGDSLGLIAAKYGTTPAQIQKYNPKTITNINNIYAGDALLIKFL